MKHTWPFSSLPKKIGWFLLVKESMPYTISEKKSTIISARLLFLIEIGFSPLPLKEASKGNLHVELSIKLVHEDIGLTFDWSCWHSSTCLLHISWKQIHNYACRWLPRYRCVRLQEVYILSLDGMMFPPGKGGWGGVKFWLSQNLLMDPREVFFGIQWHPPLQLEVYFLQFPLYMLGTTDPLRYPWIPCDHPRKSSEPPLPQVINTGWSLIAGILEVFHFTLTL